MALRFPLLLAGGIIGAFGVGWVVAEAIFTRRWERG